MSDKPQFDENYAAEIIGKKLLVGLTFVDQDKKVLEQVQFYGRIVRVSESEGIVILRFDTNEEYKLPPDLKSISKANPGEYSLRSTGEKIIDPDFLTTWAITRP